MNHSLIQLLTVVAAILSLTAAQGFYAQRYGKKSDQKQVAVRSGFYTNRYGRSSPPETDLPEVKIRSSRFVGGSRYGKRSETAPVVPEIASIVSAATAEDDSEVPASLLVGESTVCFLVDVPDIYKCFKKIVNEATSN
ncbi:uncharacterized protein LOC135223291 [Macrobrachium nipponense]|uniref:uncharacterized protein LOC135223291 n=1 Tax=Macrobrachium nipponense TaxID=159736 RepID=UPI0030C80381